MQKTIFQKETEKKYKTMSISDLEMECQSCQGAEMAARKRFIGILGYLKITKRYKENVKFKQASFGVYLEQKFYMSERKFNDERVAFNQYADRCQETSVATVVKIIKKVPVLDHYKVFDKIVRAKKKANGEISQYRVEKIIDQFTPTPKAKPEGKTIREYEAEIVDLKARLMDAEATIKGQEEQIERLENTIAKYKGAQSRHSEAPAMLSA